MDIFGNDGKFKIEGVPYDMGVAVDFSHECGREINSVCVAEGKVAWVRACGVKAWVWVAVFAVSYQVCLKCFVPFVEGIWIGVLASVDGATEVLFVQAAKIGENKVGTITCEEAGGWEGAINDITQLTQRNDIGILQEGELTMCVETVMGVVKYVEDI
eukprot:jgi/Psemu1/23450/gm1.23450_g